MVDLGVLQPDTVYQGLKASIAEKSAAGKLTGGRSFLIMHSTSTSTQKARLRRT